MKKHIGSSRRWTCQRQYCSNGGFLYQRATEAGHTVEKINLNQTEVKGCIGCNAFRYGKPCVQKESSASVELSYKAKNAEP